MLRFTIHFFGDKFIHPMLSTSYVSNQFELNVLICSLDYWAYNWYLSEAPSDDKYGNQL